MLLYTLFSGLSPQKAVAQSECNQWGIEIFKTPQQGEGPTLSCPSSNAKCGPLYYYVYLVQAGNQGGGNPANFIFSSLSISGSLSAVTPPPNSTTAAGSQFNLDLSLACSPSDINSNGGLLDASGKSFGYVVTPPGGTASWSVNGRRLLCILAVDAFMDEIVSLNNVTGGFSSPAGPLGNVNCAFSVELCNGTDCSQTLTLPDECPNGLSVQLGAAQHFPTTMQPNRQRIAVYLTSASSTPIDISDLDLSFELSTTKVVPYEIEGALLPKSAISVVSVNSLFIKFYANAPKALSGVVAAGGAGQRNTLFYIYLNGPVLSSDCAQATVRLRQGRVVLSGLGECCRLSVQAAATRIVDWGTSPCANSACAGFTVSVVPLTVKPENTNTCDHLYFALQISANSTPQVLHNIDIALNVRFDASGTLSWSQALSSTFNCSPVSACVSANAIGAGILRLNYNYVGALPITLNAPNDPITLATFVFNASSTCIQGVDFFDATLMPNGNTSPCLPGFSTGIQSGVPATHLCLPIIGIKYSMYNGASVGNTVNLKVASSAPNAPNCINHEVSDGSYSICGACASGQNYVMRPTKNDDWLNGVTTLDLALITKHNLGIELFDSPYKIIASDANKSGSVTTFDVVELRKLILGIYDTLPAVTSFRLIEGSFVFPNPSNPFQSAFPETKTFDLPPGAITAFVAVKIGDVNGTYISKNSGSADWGYTLANEGSNGVFEVPVFAQNEQELMAWQMAFQYDTTIMRLIEVRWPAEKDRYEDRAWYEPQRGEVRMLWYQVEGKVLSTPAGMPLFYARFRLKRPLAANANPALLTAGGGIRSEAYTAQGSALSLNLIPSNTPVRERVETSTALPKTSSYTLTLYPNPASGHFRIEVFSPEPATARLSIIDPLGRTLLHLPVDLKRGVNTLTSTQLPITLPSGQYFVLLDTPMGKWSKRLVKR